MNAGRPLKIGFIPLVDAASLFIAVDKGFAAREGLDVELVREVSWSNLRDRLAIGHYDAAHLLAPMAVASTLGLSHVKAPIVASLNLAFNGNAITVSPDLRAQLLRAADGDLADPGVSARALKEIVRQRERRHDEPLTFGMTFPFSMHNYLLRYWMAEGGIDPDEDVRLVVLPPPYMVENLAKGQVDGFCVGAPWNAVAVKAGVGLILHPGRAIFHPAPEKTLAVRGTIATGQQEVVEALVRACLNAASFVKASENLDEVAAILSRPDRVGVEGQAIRRALIGRLGANADGDEEKHVVIGDAASGRPHPYQAAWLYAQMLRWRQARFSREQLAIAEGVFSPAFFDAAFGASAREATDSISAFAGPVFNSADIESYLAAFPIGAKCQ